MSPSGPMGKLGGDIIRARAAAAPVPSGWAGRQSVAAGVRTVEGRAEWEALDVVPVQVGEEEAAGEGCAAAVTSAGTSGTSGPAAAISEQFGQRPDAGAGVQHQ